MTKRISSFAAVAMFLTVLAPSALAQSVPPDIKAVYDKLIAAMVNKDVKMLAATSSPNFRLKLATGQEMSAEEAFKTLDNQFKMMPGKPKMSLKFTKCVVKGSTATVWVTGTFESKMKISPDNKTGALVETSKGKDILVKSKKGWLFKSIEFTESKSTLDGKPFDPTANAPQP